MKVEKFKVLLYLKKGGLDKFRKAPIMERITVNNTMAQFSCKLSCTPELWNPRENRLNGKSKEAVDINAKIDRLLLSVNSAFDSLVEHKIDFDATTVKELLQGSVDSDAWKESRTKSTNCPFHFRKVIARRLTMKRMSPCRTKSGKIMRYFATC